MKFLSFISVMLLASASVNSYEVLAESNGASKSGGGMFPFLRVGRSRGSLTPSSSKRVSKMTVFPRVGRDSTRVYAGSDFESEDKRSDSNTALWFGPRLGVHKRDGYEVPLTYLLLNDGHGSRTELFPFSEKDFEIDEDNQKLVFEPVN